MPVLGKRARNTSPSPTTPRVLTRRRATANHDKRDLLTPEPTPNPKRPRPFSSFIISDDDSNKENIPPGSVEPRSRSRTRQQHTTLPLSQPHLSPPATPETTSIARTRAALRLHGQDDTIPLIGREQERDVIRNFLTPFLTNMPDTNHPSGLYISGAPGTGKTALVNEFISSISISHAGSLRVISINCMALENRDLNGVWERCAEEFHYTDNKQPKRTFPFKKNDWSNRFAKIFQDSKCLLILDEIDNLTSATCSPSNIFDIAANSTQLRIIGISNMHTLGITNPIQGVQTLHFGPYTASQMKAVLTSRLATLSPDTDAFSAPTIALLCMKIASQTGDIRMLFSVARRALDLSIHGSASNTPTTLTTTVSPAHILAALKACNASNQSKTGTETVARVRDLGLQARFALASLLVALRRLTARLSLTNGGANSTTSPTSASTSKSRRDNPATTPTNSAVPVMIDLMALHGFYTSLLSNGVFSGVGRTEFVDLINLLEGNGLVQLNKNTAPRKGKSKGVQTVSIASGVREEELIRGLIGNEGAELDLKEEEVGHMWHREISRIERETKYKPVFHINKPDLDDAQED